MNQKALFLALFCPKTLRIKPKAVNKDQSHDLTMLYMGFTSFLLCMGQSATNP